MIIARREFLKCLGISAGAAGLGACSGEWSIPDRLVDLALRGPGIESHRQTICGLCEGACGITVRLVDNVPVGLKGNPRHPLNQGGLCPVGQAGLEVLYAPERVRNPLGIGADGTRSHRTWDEALGVISSRLAELHSAGEGHRVAILSDEPGQLFEQLAHRFAGAIGSTNISRSRKLQALPFLLTQGIEGVPGIDLRGADLVLSFGLDVLEDGSAPVHAISAMVGSRPSGERCALIHFGTRLSPTATKAEEYVPIHPGTHAALALGIANVLVREGNYDHRFVAERTFGFNDWTDEQGRRRLGFRRLLLERYYPDRAAQLCGCDASRIIRLARRFARAATPVAIAGGEATSGSNGTWTSMAVQALNALIGAFDRPGGVVLLPSLPFTPLDPLPEPAPGTRPSLFDHAGGAAPFGVDPIEAIADGVLDGSHPLEVLILVSSNPVHEHPAGERLRRAMEKIPMVVVLSPFVDETAAGAHFVLPTHVFLEAWRESTTPPTVGLNVLGLGSPVVEPFFDTRHPADILLELARRIGPEVGDALPWQSYADYLKHRMKGLMISGQGTVFSGSFEESWVHYLEERGWRFLQHSDFEHFWKDLALQAGWWDPVPARGGRRFRTPSERFEFFSRTLERRLCEVGAAAAGESASDQAALEAGIAALDLAADGDEACLPHHEPPKELGAGDLTLVPFQPITARGRLGAVSPMILEMFGYAIRSAWETWVELAPETAHDLHLEEGDRVAVESDRAAFEAVVRVQPGSTPGVVHVPLGLGHQQLNSVARGAGSNPMAVLLASRDSLSGDLDLTSTRVRLRLVRRRPHGGPPPLERGHA